MLRLLAGAPKLGDAHDWGRVPPMRRCAAAGACDQGGCTGKKGMMPPKGGFMTLTDDEIRAAIDFMKNATAP